MNEVDDRWTDRLSEYLDGHLAPGEAEALEEHLDQGCSRCAETLAALEEVRARARSLPDREPERDLWPGIRTALHERGGPEVALYREEGATVSSEARPRRRRRVSLTLPQLAAAAVLLLALGGGAVWSFADAPPRRGGGERVTETAAPDDPVRRVAARDPEVAGYASEVRELERVLARNRERLDPNTVRIVEKNLAIIDRAIRESVEALEVDPGNAFVEDHLRRSFRQKVSYLRETTTLLNLDAG